MTVKELRQAILEAKAIMQKTLPYKTGNLSINAFKIKESHGNYTIYIDENIAPYSVWIDKPNYISYKYFDKSFEIFLEALIHLLGGETR